MCRVISPQRTFRVAIGVVRWVALVVNLALSHRQSVIGHRRVSQRLYGRTGDIGRCEVLDRRRATWAGRWPSGGRDYVDTGLYRERIFRMTVQGRGESVMRGRVKGRRKLSPGDGYRLGVLNLDTAPNRSRLQLGLSCVNFEVHARRWRARSIQQNERITNASPQKHW